MHLKSISVENFRSLKAITINYDSLTLLIGENDAGKSSILDLLEICLNSQQIDSRDFHIDNTEKIAEEIIVILEFQLNDRSGDAHRFSIGNQLKVKYIFSKESLNTERFYLGCVPQDTRLRVDFDKMTAGELTTFVKELQPDIDDASISNKSKRIDYLTKFIESVNKVEEWVPVILSWGRFLPRFERYSSLDYSSPEKMIEKTLRQVYEAAIFKDVPLADGGQVRQLVDSLQEIERESTVKIKEEVGKLTGHVQKYNDTISELSYDPIFDFSSSFRSGEFKLNLGRGLHALSRTGAGTRRRMLMGVMDWDRDVTTEYAQSQENLPTIIRGYDEPDTNLHYGAQRHMFQVIRDITSTVDTRIQAILCTHSLTMIDRAPAQNIRLLRLCDEGVSEVSQLGFEGDPEVEDFLSHIGRELGITNTLIFYERCFIIVEGPTEENALPILYRKRYGRSLLEDGIRIVNVEGNGAVRQLLKLLNYNRKELTIVFIDKDTETQKESKLLDKELRSAGFDDAFIGSNVIYVGDTEFEDIFLESSIVSCLQKNWSKTDNSDWQSSEIRELKSEKKFSDALSKKVWELTEIPCRKPDFGQKIAECCKNEEIPSEIISMFERARLIAQTNN